MRAFVLVLMLLPIAGCLDPEPAVDDAAVPGERGDALDWDVTASVDQWEHFVTEYQKRDAYLPANDDARAFLVAELEAAGFDVETRHYPACSRGVCLPGEAPADMAAIVGTLHGDLFDADGHERRIGLVSHFDTVATTLQGAYDDGSGVMAELAICQNLAAVQMRHSLSCVFFDAEEQGLEASKAYVEDTVVEGDEAFVYDYVIGYDMTGINWPGHDWKMYVMTGDADHVPMLAPFARQVLNGEMGYPDSGVEVLETHDRNSDERRFRDAGVPIYRFAGGRHAADYPEYHMPGDTVDYVYDFVDGRENFEAGFATVVEGSHALILALDGTTVDGLAD